MHLFIRIFYTFTLFFLLSFVIFQAVGTQAQGPTTIPTNTNQAAEKEIELRQSTALDNALNSVVNLPSTMFPNCTTKRFTTQEQAKSADQKLVKCVGDIINWVFIIAVLWVIIDLASSNLGIILRSGDGGKPVENARNKIERALIGLVLIGGIALLLNVFASNLTQINFFSASSQPQLQQFSVNFQLKPIAQAANQPAFYANNFSGNTIRPDIKLNSDHILRDVTNAQAGRFVRQFLAQRGVTISDEEGAGLVQAARGGTNNASAPPLIPVQQLVAAAGVGSNWGKGFFDQNTQCAAGKLNYFNVPLSAIEITTDPILKEKRTINQAPDACDFIKEYPSFSESLRQFPSYYVSQTNQGKTGCPVWESLKPGDPATCSKIDDLSKAFVEYVKKLKRGI